MVYDFVCEANLLFLHLVSGKVRNRRLNEKTFDKTSCASGILDYLVTTSGGGLGLTAEHATR